jgi:hypothetical protein
VKSCRIPFDVFCMLSSQPSKFVTFSSPLFCSSLHLFKRLIQLKLDVFAKYFPEMSSCLVLVSRLLFGKNSVVSTANKKLNFWLKLFVNSFDSTVINLPFI